MLYLPSERYLSRFQLLTWPLPPGLFPWLFNRGLDFHVLPEDVQKASNIVHKRLQIPDKTLAEDGRVTAETPQYRPKQRLILFPHAQFWNYYVDTTMLHEVGHAVDYLWSDRGLFSSQPGVAEVLRGMGPLSTYCEEKDRDNKHINIEQFATAFSLYFQESEPYREKSVYTLSKEAVSLIRDCLVAPFSGEKDVQ